MPLRQRLVLVPGFANVYSEVYSNDSNNSPREPGSGKLRLVSNGHTFLHTRMIRHKPVLPNYFGPQQHAGSVSGMFPFEDHHYNEVYAKWRGKLHKGSASLGVTLASWKQSREMIVSRTKKFLGATSDVEERILRARKRRNSHLYKRGQVSRQLASDVLEFEFGWKPLFEDMYAACNTVIAGAMPAEWVRASSKWVDYNVRMDNGDPTYVTTTGGWGRITIGAKVSIENPNLWLLNRMGLINPATVVWDLIPWSFVANMFGNFNQMISSITDTVGLEIYDPSVTRSSAMLTEQTVRYLYYPNEGLIGQSTNLTKYRVRTAGSIPRPRFQFKVPDVNWELAVIAMSLVVQKVRRISSLLL